MKTYGVWRRSRNDRMITGLCGGLGNHFNVDPSWIRIGLLLLFLTTGIGLLAYVVAYFIVPKEPEQALQYSQC